MTLSRWIWLAFLVFAALLLVGPISSTLGGIR